MLWVEYASLVVRGDWRNSGCVVPDTSNLAVWAWRVGETVRVGGAFLIGGTEAGVLCGTNCGAAGS